MSSVIGELYYELFKQYKILYSQKAVQQAQCDFNLILNEAKAKYCSKEELTKFTQSLLADYRQKNSLKKASNILTYFISHLVI